MQGMVNTLSDLRKAVSAFQRVRTLLNSTRAEPQVEAAIPPGEWWLKTRPFRRRKRPANGASAAGDSPSKKGHTYPGVEASVSSVDSDSSVDESSVASSNGSQLNPWLPGGGAPVDADSEEEEDYIAYMQCPYPYRPMPDDVAKERAQGDIVCRDVSFCYPMRPDVQVLRNVSFRLERGKMTALVGRSGAGKSTVASLLSRFYAPEAGTITMGGMDIFAWSRNAWSASVALVSQDPVLFSASIADNIAYGAPRASHATVEAAAKAANAHDFITNFPDGCGPHINCACLPQPQCAGSWRLCMNWPRRVTGIMTGPHMIPESMF